MKPFIFQFRECPTSESTDLSLLSYDSSLNLSVDAKTGTPAISSLNMATETFTKTQGEDADSDYDTMTRMMGTETVTLVNHEGLDDDRNRLTLAMLLGTSTGSREYNEQPDSDRS